MARERTKTTLDINGRQGRSLAPTPALKQDNKEGRTVPHENGKGVATPETRTRIKELAYELYLQRGRRDGYDTQDWLEAERMALTQPRITSKSISDRRSTSSTA